MYFFDTYVFVALDKGSENYKKFKDAIGYATAVYLHIPLVTGGRDFEGLPNVVFVKE